jgi:hypothetical protein
VTGVLISPAAKSSARLRKANLSMKIAILSIVDFNASCKNQPSAKPMSPFVDLILKCELKFMKDIAHHRWWKILQKY